MAGVRQFDEQQMLDKALDVFWQKGYAATTMQDIAQATGVLRGSLYNAYGDKDTLFLRVFGVYRETYVGRMRAALQKPRLRDALRAFFHFAIGSMTTGTPTRGCLSTKTAVGSEELEEPIRAALQQLIDEIEAAVHERLTQAATAKELRLPARQAARLIVTMTRGLVVMERVYGDERWLRATADSLVALLLEPGA